MIRLAGMHRDSIVDGPGIRLSIYVQGCPHRCPGCHNPETHDPGGGYEADLEELAALIKAHRAGIDGVTISGGEPFEQPEPLAALAGRVLEEGLNLIIYSGYRFEDLLAKSRHDHNIRRLLEAGWLLVDGPYRLEERDCNLPFRGSKNQRLVDLQASLDSGKAVEWPAGMEKEKVLTGADHLSGGI